MTATSAQRILGANDRVNVGLIGCGGRGHYVAGLMAKAPNTSLMALGDVWKGSIEAGKAIAGPGLPKIK